MVGEFAVEVEYGMEAEEERGRKRDEIETQIHPRVGGAAADSIVHRGDSPRALRFFGKLFKIEMLSPGGARTHDRGQLSKLFPINLNARGESPRCKIMLFAIRLLFVIIF